MQKTMKPQTATTFYSTVKTPLLASALWSIFGLWDTPQTVLYRPFTFLELTTIFP